MSAHHHIIDSRSCSNVNKSEDTELHQLTGAVRARVLWALDEAAFVQLPVTVGHQRMCIGLSRGLVI